MRAALLGTLGLLLSPLWATFLREDQTIVHDQAAPFLGLSPFYFRFGAALEPKAQHKASGGQDALLASKYLLGVADGVGAWVSQGIDPREYSYRLLHNADLYFRAYPSAYADNPAKLLLLASITNSYKGSSTMTLASLSGPDLFTANVGDSGYMILVPTLKNLPNNAGTSFVYDIVFRSDAKQHSFNFPHQLGPTGDDPLKVTEGKVHRMGFGALVLLYSDGVSDNLFPHEIKALVNVYVQELKVKAGIQVRDFVPAFDPRELAQRIKRRAFARSLDKQAISPFQVNALDWAVIFQGGKPDDISIVVGMVLKRPDEPEAPAEPEGPKGKPPGPPGNAEGTSQGGGESDSRGAAEAPGGGGN